MHVFSTYLDHNLSEYISDKYRTNCGLNKKKHAYFFSKRRVARRLEKNYFVRLILRVFSRLRAQFVRYISQKYPTYFARVFWSDLEHNLSDI